MKVRLKHIAEDTGFSVSTISRAIRSEGRISGKNRKIIIESARRLGYQLPPEFNSPPDNFPTYIAIITNFRTGEFFASFFVGFQKAAINKQVSISLFSTSENEISVSKIINEVKELGFNGAVLFIPELKEEDYKSILESLPRDFPVLSCSNIDDTPMDTVTFDAYQGATQVSRHFHKQGYSALGLIEGPNAAPEARFRTNGFLDYLQYKSNCKLLWRYQGDYTLESGSAAFENFKKLDKKPEAIFIANDAMAVGFMESARKAGYQIPNDVAIVGYDNLPLCETHFPQLSSVDTNYTLLAENAIENLLQRVKEPVQHQGLVILVPVSLKERESSLK